MTITIDLPADRAERLAELARQRNLSVEEYARLGLTELIDRDEGFRTAADYVLRKNAELYRRLAK
ncbi:MAG: DNA-binding protein [Gemmataceae bacterium]